MAILTKMGGKAQGDGWPYSLRWVAKLREMGGQAQGDGWPSSRRWVAKLREGMPSSSRCVTRLRCLDGQAQGDGYLHNAYTISTVQNTTNGNADYLLQLLHPHFQNVQAINLMEIYVLKFNCSVYVSCPAFPPCMSLFPLKNPSILSPNV